MAQINASNRQARTRRRAVLGAVALLLAGCNMSPEQDAAAIERDILGTPGTFDLWPTIKEEYPEDFAQLIAQIQALDYKDRNNPDVTKQIGGTFLIDLIARIAPDAVRAPAPELLAWSRAESNLYATLKRGAVSECASLTMGKPIFVNQSNAAATSAIARRTVAIIRAAAAAGRDPQTYAEPAEAEWVQLFDAIAATGLPPDLQNALGSETAMQSLTEEQQCDVGAALYAGLSNLPDDVEPHVAAFVLGAE